MEDANFRAKSEYQSSHDTAAFLAKCGKHQLSTDLIVATLQRIDLDVLEQEDESTENLAHLMEIKKGLSTLYMASYSAANKHLWSQYRLFAIKCFIASGFLATFLGLGGIFVYAAAHRVAGQVNVLLSQTKEELLSAKNTIIGEAKANLKHVYDDDKIAQAYAFYKGDASFLYQKAQLAIEDGKFGNAETFLKRALIIESHNKTYLKLLEKLKSDDEYYYKRAVEIEQSGDVARAMLFVQHAIDIAPHDTKYKNKWSSIDKKLSQRQR